MDTSGPAAISQADPTSPVAPVQPPAAAVPAAGNPGAEEADPGDAIDPYLASLRQRQPNLEAVLEAVKKSHTYKKVIQHNKHVTQGSSFYDDLFDRKPWDVVSGELVDAVYKCHATKESQANSRTKKFLEIRRRILRKLSKHAPEGIHGKARGEWEATIYLLGVEFLKAWVAQLVDDGSRPPLEKLVEGAMHPDANWKPEKLLSETIYYIAGYLIAAAEKAGLRRGEKSVIGMALRRLAGAKHDVKSSENLEKIQSELPTGKVDRMVAFGGLKYPTAEFYSMVCRVENIYRTTLTDDILIVEGGSVIRRVNESLLENDHLCRIFNTFLPSDLDEEDQTETLRCFLRIFGHLRGKDVVRKKMSLWRKKPTVGHRQTLAALSQKKSTLGSKKKKKKKKKAEGKKKSDVAATTAEDGGNGTMSQEKSDLAATTAEDGGNGAMSQGDKEAIEEHAKMMDAVKDSVDSGACNE